MAALDRSAAVLLAVAATLTSCSVSISSAAWDLAGNGLVQPATWSFTTGRPPAASSAPTVAVGR
jgi:hypothetical protein